MERRKRLEQIAMIKQMRVLLFSSWPSLERAYYDVRLSFFNAFSTLARKVPIMILVAFYVK